ncbi:MAG: hypothetical protein JSS27_00980 [Planctomycetes bacterium]|nr:hypothetical protein [Planctomycetota bacterium]
MAYSIDYVKEIGSGGRGGGRSYKDLGTSTRVFEIKLSSLDSRSDYTDQNALYESGIPAFRDAHPTRPFIYCANKHADNTDRAGQFWVVKCDYEWLDAEELPWNRAPVWSGGGLKQELPVDKISSTGNVDDSGDAGKPILNTAGQPYDPTLTRVFTFPVVSASFAVQNWSAVNSILSYQDALNSGSFFGYGAGYVKLDDVSWQQVREDIGGVYTIYYTLVLKFVVNTIQSWQPQVLNAGFFEKKSGNLRQILINGQPPAQPWPLDNSGLMLPVDGSGTVIFKRYDIQPMMDFSALPSGVVSGPP